MDTRHRTCTVLIGLFIVIWRPPRTTHSISSAASDGYKRQGPFLIQKYQKGDTIGVAEMTVLTRIVDDWRLRLASVSEFMQQLNQVIARQANIEENCTGRFWEGPLRSQPLLTEAALLTAIAYSDLNPIRAKMADTLEQSEHTSIKKRIKPSFNLARALDNNPDVNQLYIERFSVKPLASLEGNLKYTNQTGVLFSHVDYLTLVDTTGRIQRQDKRGFISDTFLPILQRLAIDADKWIETTQNFGMIFL